MLRFICSNFGRPSVQDLWAEAGSLLGHQELVRFLPECQSHPAKLAGKKVVLWGHQKDVKGFKGALKEQVQDKYELAKLAHGKVREGKLGRHADLNHLSALSFIYVWPNDNIMKLGDRIAPKSTSSKNQKQKLKGEGEGRKDKRGGRGWPTSNSCMWKSCVSENSQMYEGERAVREKVACEQVVCERAACARVVCDNVGLPSDSIASRGEVRQEPGCKLTGRCLYVCPASALAHRPCCHTWLRAKHLPQAHKSRHPTPPASEVTGDQTMLCWVRGLHAQ